MLPVSAVNVGALNSLPPTLLDRQLAAIHAEGVTVVRDDASWGQAEPYAPRKGTAHYRFAVLDALVARFAAHGLTWLPIIDYSAPWAGARRRDWRSPPARDAQFAAFARAVAGRYGAGGAFWHRHPQLAYLPATTFEIWNEENGVQFWDTGPNAPAYGRLYLGARAAIKSADPGARVIVGGLMYHATVQGDDAAQFLKTLYAVPGIAGEVDGVALHPYAEDASTVTTAVKVVRGTLATLGAPSLPIYLTEFGWTTGAPLREAWRAAQMRQVAAALGNSNCGIAMLAPYDWYDPTVYASGGDFGLSSAATLRAAGAAWFEGLAVASGQPPAATCG